MKGDLSLDKELEVMSKFKLDANHWIVVKYLFIAKYENDPSYLFRYFLECSKTGAPRDILLSLKDKKIISKDYIVPEKGKPLDIKNIEFEETFLKQYFKTSVEAGRELFNAYPPYLKMDNGVLLPARNLVSKVIFKTLDDFFLFYAKSIKFDISLHNKIMKSLEFAKEHDLIKSAIVEYCVSEKWRDHIDSMEKDNSGNFITRFESSELL